MSEPFKNIRFVLVRPTRPGNIGAAARSIKNMGLSRLHLVQPVKHLQPDAYTMAYGAHDTLEKAKVFKTLPKAISRCQYVVGTTGRTHKGYGKPVPLMKQAARILDQARTHQVAILFGPESSGLSNDEIALCQSLVSIPTGSSHTSINLAQAVMVVAYELLRTHRRRTPDLAPGRIVASTGQRERFYAELKTMLTLIGFLKGPQGKHILADLRRIVGRAELDARELRIFRGIIRQTQWALLHKMKDCFPKAKRIK